MTKNSADQSQTGIKIYTNNPWNLLKTALLLLTWIVMGIHIELIGPTMSILAANINADYSGMGSALAARGAGYLVANIIGAVLQNIVKKHSDGLLVAAYILPAIVVFATPFVQSLILLSVLLFIQGIAHGLTDLGGNNLLLTMWGEHAAAPLNTAHLGYGIGAVIVNLLVRPFLITDTPSISDSATTTNPIVLPNKSNIIIPYTITAVLCALIAVGHTFFYIRALKAQKRTLEVQQVDYAVVSTNPDDVVNQPTDKKLSSLYSPATCGRGDFQYGLFQSILFIFSIFFIIGNDQAFSKFFFIYLKSENFNISTGAASSGVILYWLSYSIGRLILAIVSVFVPVTTSLSIVWFGGLCLAMSWLIFVWVISLTGTSLFILGTASGLVFSPLIPLTFALFNQRLNVIPILLALVLCGSAFGIIIFQKIAGIVMNHNPNHFPTISVICIMVSILLFLISNFLNFFHQRQKSQVEKTKGETIKLETFNEEEQQMEKYLKDQEDA